MNSIQTATSIDVMQGFIDSKRIQCRAIQELNTDPWVDIVNPSWNWEIFTFRIAPWYIRMIEGDLDRVLCHVDESNQDIVRVITSAEESIDVNGDTILSFSDGIDTWDYAVPVDEEYSESVTI